MSEVVMQAIGSAGGWLAGLAAIIAALLGAYLKGRRAGRAAANVKRVEDALQDRKTRDEIENDNAVLSDAALRNRLRHWER